VANRESLSNVASLATVLPGQDVEIVRVLLRDGASGDPQHRLRPGRQWHCRYSGSVNMLLVSDTGETISVSRDAARYIQVSPVLTGTVDRQSGLSARDARGRSR
jgi:hypothetical protein